MESIFAFFTYFVILLLIGLFSRVKMRTDGAYVMGNRSLNYWVTALSAHSSDMSTWLFMAFPGAIYMFGLGKAWIGVGLLGGMWLNWQLIAPRLRVATEKYDSYTLSTFFERRFNDTSGAIRLFSSLLILIFLTVYLTAGVVGIGLLIEILFGIDYFLGIFIVMPVLIFYVYLGGYRTVAWIDFFQGIFLLVMIFLVPFVAFYSIGGWGQIITVASEKGVPLKLWDGEDQSINFCNLLFGLGWGLGYFGQPHILTKFMGIKDPGETKKAKYVGMAWQLLALTAAIMAGVVAIGFFSFDVQNPELNFMHMTKSLFTPFVATFILCALLAASMSTMDSQVLVAGSIVSEDIVRRLKKGISSSTLLKISRIGVIVVASFATFFAVLFKDKGVMDIVSYAWSGLGATIGPIVFASLYAKRINRYGVICGIVMGGITSALWPVVEPVLLEKICIVPVIPAFILSWLTMEVVSFATKEI